MTIFQQLIEAAQFEITEGSEYMWHSFGAHARWLDFKSAKYEAELSIVFDSQNQEVYQAMLYVPEGQFRWTKPENLEMFEQESFEREIDPRISFENSFFSDCTVFEDFIVKVKDSFTTGKCDSSILISIELTPEQEDLFSKLPEETDLEKFILNSLQEKIDIMSKQHKENWDIVFSMLAQNGKEVTLDIENAPISENNIQEIYTWLNVLKITQINLSYTDKMTAEGVISYLKVNKEDTPELVFQYNYKNKK